MAQTQSPAYFRHTGWELPYTPVGDVWAGDVVLIGTIPMMATVDIPAGRLGALQTEGVYDVPKTSDTFTAGDAVYWNSTGTPVTGTAGTGAADSSSGSGYLMGWAMKDAAAGDDYVNTMLTASKRTTSIGGSVTADDIVGSDSTLTMTGAPPATTSSAGGAVTGAGGIGGSVSGAGGAVSWIGGAGTTNAAGGTGTFSGGAGNGTGAGGAVTTKGGAGGAGATGNGGAWTAGGGASLATNGTGGAASLTGGVGTGTGVGGAVTIAGGASGGASGTGGALTLDAGAAAGGTAGAITIGTNAASITMGKMPRIPTATVAAAGTVQGDAAALTDGFTLVTGATNAGVLLPAAVAGRQVIIKNNVAGNMKVWPTSGDAINAIAADSALTMATLTTALFVAYDATTWYTLSLLPS